MKVTIAYTDTCLPDYFRGDARPWVVIYPTESGYTSRELREAIMGEFELGAVGGSDTIARSFQETEAEEKRSDMFFQGGKLQACLNRDIRYRGKILKYSEFPDNDWSDDYADGPVMHVVFNIED